MAYARQYQATMAEFQQEMVRLTSRPLPKLTDGTPKEKRREAAAKSIDDIVQADTRLIARLDALTPPPALRRIHDATRNMLVTTRKGNAGFAHAIRQGSGKGIEKNRLEAEAADKTAIRKMAEASRLTAQDPNVSREDAKLLLDEATKLTEAAKNLTP